MSSKTISSREFNQDTGRAKRAAESGPVFITDRGRPRHVLLTMAAYEQLLGGPSLLDALAQPEAEDIDFEPDRLRGELARPVDLG